MKTKYLVSREVKLVPFWGTNIVSSNSVHGDVYSIQHSVIKFVSDLQQVGGILLVLWFPPLIKLQRYNWNIVESGIKHHNPNLDQNLKQLFSNVSTYKEELSQSSLVFTLILPSSTWCLQKHRRMLPRDIILCG
jgi:hypothetical protein